jgi:hypothetical protein
MRYVQGGNVANRTWVPQLYQLGPGTPAANQPLTVGPTREIVIRTITRRSRSMAAR